MESITPLIDDPKDIVKIDGDDITTNLFKNVSLPPKIDKLETYLRIRPTKEQRSKIYHVNDDNVLCVKKEKKDTQRYEFSRIFHEETSQETVYKYCAQPLVSKFVEGNDALLFAYGTTSSGKSFTIRGDDSRPGIIQRVLRALFSNVNASSEPLYKRKNYREFEKLNPDQRYYEKNMRGRYTSLSQPNFQKSLGHFKDIEVERECSFDENITFVFWVSFLEYYNEKPIDLLAFDGDQKPLKIYDNGAVQGLKHVFVSSAEEAFRIFLYGQARLNDHIRSNGLNLQSSRSHSMFTITAIAMTTRTQRPVRVNNLAVCDLAGNERSNKTQSKGVRLREAGKINTSLLSLQNVIKGLRTSQKNKKDNSFVSYRDSKLTRSFKPFLDGTGFASMIINMNPSANLVDETIGSLDFSATAQEVVVSTEDSRRQLQDSWKRLSQQWITSKQRWSSFAQSRKSLKFNVGDTLLEEIEEEELSVADIDGEFERLSMVVQNNVDANEIDYYKSRIEILNAQIEMMNAMIEDAESEQFQREMEIRNELANKNKELNENLIQQHAAEKEKLRRENDEFMEKRLQIVHTQREREKIEFDKKKESLEKQLFELREKYIELECKLAAYETREYQEKSTSTHIVTLDTGIQTDTHVTIQEYSMREDDLSLVNMALHMALQRTYCDVSCGVSMEFAEKCVETDIEFKQDPEVDEKSTSMNVCTSDNWTQSETLTNETSDQWSNTSYKEVLNQSVQYDEIVQNVSVALHTTETSSNTSLIEKCNQSVQCDEMIENDFSTLHYSTAKETTIIVESSSISTQTETFVSFVDQNVSVHPEADEKSTSIALCTVDNWTQFETITNEEKSSNTSHAEVTNKSMQCEEMAENDSSTLRNSVEVSEEAKVVISCSMSTQTDSCGSYESLQKQLKEKEAIISLKEDIIVNLQNKVKAKDDEIEKMSVGSAQSLLSSYGDPYRPKKPKITISDPVDQVYLQTMSAREKELKSTASVKKLNVVECLESASKVETEKVSYEGKKVSGTGKKGSETGKVEAAKKTVERPKRNPRKRSEPELEEDPIDDDIGAAVFSTGKSTNHSLRTRKREKNDKFDEEISKSKRMKMPKKEKRHVDSISPVVETQDTKQTQAYNFRSRKRLYK